MPQGISRFLHRSIYYGHKKSSTVVIASCQSNSLTYYIGRNLTKIQTFTLPLRRDLSIIVLPIKLFAIKILFPLKMFHVKDFLFVHPSNVRLDFLL